MFYNFQTTMFNIIEEIANNQQHHHDEFIQQWKHLTAKHGVNGKSSFTKIKHSFKFDDLKAYITFLQQCPDLDDYIIIRSASKGMHCYEFGTLQKQASKEERLHDYTLIFTLLPGEQDQQDITELIALFTKLLNDYIVTYPNHPQSNTYRDWLDGDFTDITSAPELLKITECITLRHLIKMLQSTQFLQQKLIIKWNHDIIEFHLSNNYNLTSDTP
jgi:hypothetical protein